MLNCRCLRTIAHRSVNYRSCLARRSVNSAAATDGNERFPVAIVGTGPSAFYTAKYLLDQDPRIHLDFYEKLPTPYGLVRYGVAPDHPEVKIVIHTFEEVMEKHKERVRLFANVEVRDSNTNNKDKKEEAKSYLPLSQLREHYSAVVLAYGADSDHSLHIPGSDLPGVLSAHEFVNWYNGHPNYTNLLKEKNLHLSEVKEVIVVGQGNVALDVARILAKDINGELYSTDIARHAVEELQQSSIEKITVIGRRGHVQAAFTIKELRELTKIENVNVKIYQDELDAGNTDSTVKELENNRPKKRIVDLIQQIADKNKSNPEEGKEASSTNMRMIEIRFLMSPKQIVKNESTGRVGKLVVSRTKLEGEPFHQKAVSTGKMIELGCDLLLTSIGYKSSSISNEIPFDAKRNVVSNSRGRVGIEGNNVLGMYVTGWLKRGPTGIIGSNITDAKETSFCVIEDIKNHVLHSKPATTDPVQIISTSSIIANQIFQNAVSWQEAQRLHDYEIKVGQAMQPARIREKITNVNEMVRVAKSSQ